MGGEHRRRRWWLGTAIRGRGRGGAGALAVVVVVVVVVTVVVMVAVAVLGSATPGRVRPATPTVTATTASTTAATSTTTATASPAPGRPALPALPAPGGETFGANVNRLFNDAGYPPALIDAQLQALRATGATVARSDALWEASEPTAPAGGVHRYDWAFDDRIAGALARHGLTWLAILDYSAPWAQSLAGQDHSPPRSDADYAAYAGAFAARFGAGGSFWREHPGLPSLPVATIEIWNEPDSGQFWTPSPDPARYADLYLSARSAIDAVAPGTRVIVGGLTDPPGFLPALLVARPQLRGHVDGVAIHPYGTPAVVLARIRTARSTLLSLGMASVPLYVTEFGWTTEPPGTLDYVTASRRGRYITRTLAALGHLDCGLAAAVLYTWVTPQRDPVQGGDWYGIHAPDGSSTPDTTAFTAGLRAAGSPGPSLTVCAS